MKKPKGETVWCTHTKSANKIFYITSKENDRSMYFLYDKDWNKIGKNSNPLEFRKLYK